jgi:hypothetical protein
MNINAKNQFKLTYDDGFEVARVRQKARIAQGCLILDLGEGAHEAIPLGRIKSVYWR